MAITVDDLLVVGSKLTDVDAFQILLAEKYKVKRLGIPR